MKRAVFASVLGFVFVTGCVALPQATEDRSDPPAARVTGAVSPPPELFEHPSHQAGAALTCNAGWTLRQSECTSEVPGAAVALRTTRCAASGVGAVTDPCTVEQCRPDYEMKGNTCAPLACVPNASLGEVDCAKEIPGAELAAKSKSCDATGHDFKFGACRLGTCMRGYYPSGGACLPQACTPNARDVEPCSAPYASFAFRTRTCSSAGDHYDYGGCFAQLCQPGYVLSNDSCAPQQCQPGYVDVVSCSDQILHASVATRQRFCSADGLGYSYGACTLRSCATGYRMDLGSCVAQACTPSTSQTVSCANDVFQAAVATRTQTCNAEGSGYTFSTCTVSSCNPGYVLRNGVCIGDFHASVRFVDAYRGAYDPSLGVDLAQGPIGFQIQNTGTGPGYFSVSPNQGELDLYLKRLAPGEIAQDYLRTSGYPCGWVTVEMTVVSHGDPYTPVDQTVYRFPVKDSRLACR